jgi:hypothetical protein
MTDIISVHGGPLTAQQRRALRKLYRDLQRMHLAHNGEQSLARAVSDLIAVLLPGCADDEQEAPPAQASG